jgi:acyl-coenzyme A thioesterase PaaI-like protein
MVKGVKVVKNRFYASDIERASLYADNLARLKKLHHSRCLFNREDNWLPKLRFVFDDTGVLHGDFTANQAHQGYDDKLHGGVLAAIIDASMAQCLMGHGIAGYTADLSVKYRKPVFIGREVTLTTKIHSVNVGVLYTLHCEMNQDGKSVVTGVGRFYQFA